jgi:hypothetical protein
MQMLEEMWHSLVALLHPTMHQQPHTLDQLFELLKDATWHDFFQVPSDAQQPCSFTWCSGFAPEDAQQLL